MPGELESEAWSRWPGHYHHRYDQPSEFMDNPNFPRVSKDKKSQIKRIYQRLRGSHFNLKPGDSDAKSKQTEE